MWVSFRFTLLVRFPSSIPPGRPPRPLLHQFWEHLGSFFGSFWCAFSHLFSGIGFYTHFVAFRGGPPPRRKGRRRGVTTRALGKSEKTRLGGAGACTGCILHTLRSCALVREINEVNLLYNNCESYEVTEQLNNNCESYEVTEQLL